MNANVMRVFCTFITVFGLCRLYPVEDGSNWQVFVCFISGMFVEIFLNIYTAVIKELKA